MADKPMPKMSVTKQFSISLDEISQRVRTAVYEKYDPEMRLAIYCKEIFDDYVIMEDDEENKLLKIAWSLDADGNVILGEEQEVEEIYKPVETPSPAVAPSFTMPQSAEIVERPARLLEAGDYSNTHGIVVTEDDIDTIIGNFDSESGAPLKIEHQDTPFDGFLGTVKKLWRQGKELWSTIAFSPVAWALAERAGAKKLSVGINPEKTKLGEVSLVRNPRIASAQVFQGGAVCFDAGDISDVLYGDTLARFSALLSSIKITEEVTDMTEDEIRAEREAHEKEVSDLQFSIRARDAKDALAVHAAKLSDETRPLAETILMSEDPPIVDAFGKFLAAQPEIPAPPAEDADEGEEAKAFSAEEEALLGKLGVTTEQAKKYAA
ncbi:MAG TPA: hypothetical protein VFI02_20590 [Armatimonadota bacterium]|nr:hypothetical protein [Armatimonadota bacterium]